MTALDSQTLDWLGAAHIPSSNAAVILIDDQLFVVGDLNSLWPIDDEHVIAGPPIRLDGLETMYVGDTGDTMWLVEAAARALRPVTLEGVMSATITTTPGAKGPAVAWQHTGIGMIDSFLATSGRIVLADIEQVYVADGFGGREEGRNVAALSASAGEVAWTRDDLADGDSVFTSTHRRHPDCQWPVRHCPGGRHRQRRCALDSPAPRRVRGGRERVCRRDADRHRRGADRGRHSPTLVYGLDLADGSQRWLTSLTDGTDPPVALAGDGRRHSARVFDAQSP